MEIHPFDFCVQAQKELLDAELDFHKKMSSGEDTTDLKRKLGQLQVEVINTQFQTNVSQCGGAIYQESKLTAQIWPQLFLLPVQQQPDKVSCSKRSATHSFH